MRRVYLVTERRRIHQRLHTRKPFSPNSGGTVGWRKRCAWAFPVRTPAHKPKQYTVFASRDLVEVATLDVRPVRGEVFKQFTAHDVISRWDVPQAHSRAKAQTATQFLDTLQHRMPFPIRALQVDGGSEFAAEFEPACQQRGLHPFVLPPRSPKPDGVVERVNRTHTEEF